jgi:hypothetical protein
MALSVDEPGRRPHPSPLQCDDFLPQKECLNFDIDEAEFTEEELKIVRAIKEVKNSVMFAFVYSLVWYMNLKLSPNNC